MEIVDGTLSTTISKKARLGIIESRKKVDATAQGNKAIYGINTGFGPLCDTQITPKETNQLQVN
jgi:histidine ammonia-lyase